jgi:hypothetical protein
MQASWHLVKLINSCVKERYEIQNKKEEEEKKNRDGSKWQGSFKALVLH